MITSEQTEIKTNLTLSNIYVKLLRQLESQLQGNCAFPSIATACKLIDATVDEAMKVKLTNASLSETNESS